MKENPDVTLPLKHDTNVFIGCLMPRFICFFRVIAVATKETEWKNISLILIYREIYPPRDRRRVQAGFVEVLSVSILFALRFVRSEIPTLTPWQIF